MCPADIHEQPAGKIHVRALPSEPAGSQEPFDLAPWVRVVDPSRFSASLRADAQAGPSGPRARTGAFLEDLERLADLFGGEVEKRGRTPKGHRKLPSRSEARLHGEDGLGDVEAT